MCNTRLALQIMHLIFCSFVEIEMVSESHDNDNKITGSNV